jgi:hypothetical protein
VGKRIELRQEAGERRFRKWRNFVNQARVSSPLVPIEEEEEEIQDSGIRKEGREYRD